MGNKPLNDVKANTTVKCECFNKPAKDEMVIRKHLGDTLLVKNEGNTEIKYRYVKKTRRGHVYTKNIR
jgi:hypothetical protein